MIPACRAGCSGSNPDRGVRKPIVDPATVRSFICHVLHFWDGRGTRMRLSIQVVGLCALLVFAASPTASARPKVDDFPTAVDHSVIGGWHGAFGDGLGRSVTSTA